MIGSLHVYVTPWQSQALPGTNAETLVDSHRLGGNLRESRFIVSHPEGSFNPPVYFTLTAEVHKEVFPCGNCAAPLVGAALFRLRDSI